MGFTQNFRIWHGSSLGTLIMIQEEPIWRTIWGSCFGHKRAIFWSFLGKGEYRIHPEFWNLAWIIPGHIDYNSERTNLKDQVRIMFWPFLGKESTGYTQQYEIWHGASLVTLIQIQEEPIWRTMWGPCFGHKRVIFWPFLGKGDYGINPKLWNLEWSLSWHNDCDSGRANLKDHVRTMFWP